MLPQSSSGSGNQNKFLRHTNDTKHKQSNTKEASTCMACHQLFATVAPCDFADSVKTSRTPARVLNLGCFTSKIFAVFFQVTVLASQQPPFRISVTALACLPFGTGSSRDR